MRTKFVVYAEGTFRGAFNREEAQTEIERLISDEDVLKEDITLFVEAPFQVTQGAVDVRITAQRPDGGVTRRAY